MTWALCLYCGATKFGAICPCPACEVNSTGDMNLDITFSDHRMSVSTLEALGEVVRSIRRVCDDAELGFWSFIYFVATNSPGVLGVNLQADRQRACSEVLERANPPPVKVEESERWRTMRESKPQDGESGA